ncbi:MAG TPA: hypothetical protein ENI16_01135 [Candidatus Portnoybacteria bacterium]|nr:hypothetical protein [Candidatus Portnoybacteria bacterium]
MDKKLLKKLETKLKGAEKTLTRDLKYIAKKDKRLEGDYDTKFPQIGRSLDESATEVNIYQSTLPVEHALEKTLLAVKEALLKIRKGGYGICEKCDRKIDPKRLEAIPEAKTCLKCKK